MVCINCGNETKVFNSRLNKKTNSVWRRRRCLSCSSSFTTKERPNLSGSLIIEATDGSISQFSRDKLYLSIFQCLEHNYDAVDKATTLTETVIGKLTSYISFGYVSSSDIRHIVQVALSRYDNLASIKYQTENN
jgi:transcriptional regulator NrdR family protein